MTLLQRILLLLKKKEVKEDVLFKVSEKLQLQIGFNNAREEISKGLENIAKNKNEPANFVLLGEQGVGKTIAARDLMTDYLFAINRINIQSFFKIELFRLDKSDFINQLSTRFESNKGGLIFVDEVHNLRNYESVFFDFFLKTLTSTDYSNTSFVISAGRKSWEKVSQKYQDLTNYFQTEIYFRPYLDEELLEILKEIISKDNIINLPDDSVLESIITELKLIRERQHKYFENATELSFYYFKCLKRASRFLNTNNLEPNVIQLSLKNFRATVINR